MISTNAFVELDRQIHDRNSFDCGVDDLNEFLKKKARRHAEAGISRTWVLPGADLLTDGKQVICAFYTLAPTTVHREDFGEHAHALPHYPIPCHVIGQMGVHRDAQKQNLGEFTLINALERIVGIKNQSAGYAVLVDCLYPEIRSFYEKYGFKELCPVAGVGDKVKLFMSMREVEASL